MLFLYPCCDIYITIMSKGQAATRSDPTAITAPSLGELTLYFLRLGALGFGGPIALVGYMHRDLVERERWVSEQEYREGLAFSQLAPGPLAAQLAMYLGLIRGGFAGATLVGTAFILPSFLMVVALAVLYTHYGGLSWIQASFYGIAPAVIAVIAQAVLKLVKTTVGRDPLLWLVFVVLAASTAISEREIVWLFVGSGIVCAGVRGRSSPPAGLLPGLFLLTSLPGSGKLLEVFLFFAKAGLFVFGSGLAIVPFLHGGVVQEHQWLSERQFLDAVAVAMITPGPVVITVGFIGYLVAGFWGAVAAAAGVFLPVYLVTLFLGRSYRDWSRSEMVRTFVAGVTAAAAGAMAGAMVVLGKRAMLDVPTLAIGIVSLIAVLRFKIPEPLLIVGAGLAGILLYPN